MSYAHRDSAEVLGAIRTLNARGCRVWYDEGIEAGEDWAGKIGASLEKSALVLFFASKSAVKSGNVLRELTYAREHEIPILTVTLGQLLMPDAFRRLLLVDQTVDLAAFRTYGAFGDRIFPRLEKAGVTGSETRDIPEEPIVFAGRRKRRRRLGIACGVIAGAAAAALLAFFLLFREVPAVVGLEAEKARAAVEARSSG